MRWAQRKVPEGPRSLAAQLLTDVKVVPRELHPCPSEAKDARGGGLEDGRPGGQEVWRPATLPKGCVPHRGCALLSLPGEGTGLWGASPGGG